MIKGTDKKCCVFGKKKKVISLKVEISFQFVEMIIVYGWQADISHDKKKLLTRHLSNPQLTHFVPPAKCNSTYHVYSPLPTKGPRKSFLPPLPIRARSLLQNRRMTHEHGNEWGTQTQMKWGKCSEAEEGYVLLNASANKPKTITSSYFFFLKRDRESTVSELHHYFFTT